MAAAASSAAAVSSAAAPAATRNVEEWTLLQHDAQRHQPLAAAAAEAQGKAVCLSLTRTTWG